MPRRRRDAPEPPTRQSSSLGWLAIVVVALGLILIGIGIARDGGGGDEQQTSSPSAPVAPTTDVDLRGFTLALDPGHNGGNAAHPQEVNALVPDGRGRTKACNTTGTATADGYPEHAFTWDVAVRVKTLLEDLGASVLLTREDDDGVGPCVDERGRFGQEHDADAVVSIHGNGSEDASRRGFFAILADPPVHPSQGEPSRELAGHLLTALEDAGFSRSPDHPDGISLRSDIAGLNHAERPAVLLELGEMRNEEDAAVMSSPAGRQRFAEAIAEGLAAWAGG